MDMIYQHGMCEPLSAIIAIQEAEKTSQQLNVFGIGGNGSSDALLRNHL